MKLNKCFSFETRFWTNVDICGEDECWNWKLATTKNGYGRVRVSKPRRRQRNSHRVAFEIFYKVHLPKHIHVLHRCNNKRCVNPKHLYLGNQTVNWEQYTHDFGLTVEERRKLIEKIV